MSSLTYAMMTNDDGLSKMFSDLKKGSRPSVEKYGDTVAIEDNSGHAQMEHFYDTFRCETVEDSSGRNYARCHYAYKLPADFAKLSGWSIDWKVVLKPGMRVLDSDHQRVRHVNGHDELLWYFD